MKTPGLALALLVPLTFASALPAGAKLTPLQQLPLEQMDVTSLHTGPAAASLERNYFQAPQQPVATRAVAPCTVQIVMFDKARLAQACY
ncbi:MAG: hypothetical protein Q8M24_05395 [Pseudolabrys sp.]|nr:hypothetical protein [Pseudolabrys sp.]MDP2294880.1 hypothetical protein [Pseudolabrys sp.]